MDAINKSPAAHSKDRLDQVDALHDGRALRDVPGRCRLGGNQTRGLRFVNPLLKEPELVAIDIRAEELARLAAFHSMNRAGDVLNQLLESELLSS